MTLFKLAMALAAGLLVSGCVNTGAVSATGAASSSFAAPPTSARVVTRAARIPGQLTEEDIVRAVQASL